MPALRADIEDSTTAAKSPSPKNSSTPTPPPSAPHILATLEDVCTAESIPYKKMVSRAYHDTIFIARIAPVAMLFIPCRNGVSTAPTSTPPPNIALGTRVLALALASLH